MGAKQFEEYIQRHKFSNWSIDYHTHESYELVYYITGRGTTTINTEEYAYSDKSFVLIPPGTPHKEKAETETDLCCLSFQSTEDNMLQTSITARSDENESLLKLLKQIETEIKYRRPRHEEVLELLVSQIKIEIFRICLGNQPTGHKDVSKILSSTLSYICNHYNTEINLQQLAQSIGYSYDRFRHLFKECYGYSPKQFILWHRISKAQEMLRKTNLSVAEISKKVGFHNTGQFHEIFMKFIKMTPIQYKKKYGN